MTDVLLVKRQQHNFLKCRKMANLFEKSLYVFYCLSNYAVHFILKVPSVHIAIYRHNLENNSL